MLLQRPLLTKDVELLDARIPVRVHNAS
jgi:hypothetical protein